MNNGNRVLGHVISGEYLPEVLDVDDVEAVHHLLGVIHSRQTVGLRLPSLVDVGHAAPVKYYPIRGQKVSIQVR